MTCLSLVFQAMLALQPDAPWQYTYLDTAAATCAVAYESPIYPDDPLRSAALLTAVEYYEARFSPYISPSSCVCMEQVSRAWIEKYPTLHRCLTVAAGLLRASLEQYGDLRSYTHGTPYPRVDHVGALRLHLAKRILADDLSN